VPAEFTTWLRGLFPEKRHPDPRLLATNATANLYLTTESNITVTFMHEGAGYRNQLGYFLFDSNNQIVPGSETMLFPDVSFHGPGCLEVGDSLTFGPLPAGSNVGWWIQSDGFRTNNRGRYYSIKELHAAWDNLRHVALAMDVTSGNLLIGFEDLRNGGDRDYNDVMFVAEVHGSFKQDDVVKVKDGSLDFCMGDAKNITNFVEQDGWRYALLDNTDPDYVEQGCQFEQLPVPDGWYMVPNEPIHLAAIASRPWATPCVVLEDGSAFMPATSQPCPSDRTFLDGDLSINCQGVTSCARVMIMQRVYDSCANINPDPTFTAGGGTTAAGWSRPPTSVTAGGYQVADDSFSGSSANSIKVCVDSNQRDAGAEWRVRRDQVTEPHVLRFLDEGGVISAWSRTDGMVRIKDGAVEADAQYSIYIDVVYTDGTEEFGVSVNFRGGSHSWEWRENVWTPLPGKTVSEFVVTLLLRDVTGCALFSDVVISCGAASNLVRNPSFAERRTLESQTDAKYWFHLDNSVSTYTPVVGVSQDGPGATSLHESISCPNGLDTTADMCGAQQFIQFNAEEQAAQNFNALFVFGCAKSTGVTGVRNADFSVYLDLWFADGRREYARVVPFPNSQAAGSGWTCLSETFPANGTLEQINVAVLYRNRGAATVYFDNIVVRPLLRDQSLNDAVSYGDPHFRAIAGDMFDVQALGDFKLYDDGVLTVNTRHTQVGNVAAVNSAVAAELDGSRVQLTRASGTEQPTLRINGGRIRITCPGTAAVLGSNHTATLFCSGAVSDGDAGLNYRIVWSTGHQLIVNVAVSSFGVQFFAVRVISPTGTVTAPTGLLTLSPSSSGARRMRRRLLAVDVAAFRIDDENDSAFRYDSGTSPATYVDDPNFGLTDPDLSQHYTADQISAAQASCSSLATNLRDACIIDALAIGDHTAAVQAIGSVQTSMGLTESSVLNVEDGSGGTGGGGGGGTISHAPASAPAMFTAAALALGTALLARRAATL